MSATTCDTIFLLMEWNINTPSPWDWNNFMEQVEVDNGASVLVNASSSKEKDDEASTVPLGSDGMVGPIEQVIGLKLGKRTYFEDVCAGGNVKTSSSSSSPSSTAVPAAKKSGASHHRSITPRCQVEGCNLDLSSVKDYYCRLRVCVRHSKFPKVVVAGLERRFCQQCSRFHGLLEFDEKKRSCRRRLSHHNARRRKPQPVAVQYNLGRTSSSMFDARQQTSLPFHRLPFTHTRPELLSQGIEETSDVRSALCRLSNYQWLTGNTEPHCLNHHMNANHTPMADSTMHAVPQGLPEYWQTEHQPGGSEMQTLASQINGGNCFQELQLLKAPFESGLCSDQMN